MAEGWTWLRNSTKWHYFRSGRSLCGKFLLLRDPDGGYEQGGENSKDNCSACRKKRLKEIGSASTDTGGHDHAPHP